MADPFKLKCSSCIGAIAAYLGGLALFSVWSFTAHRNELLSFVDKSRLYAAHSTRELIEPDIVRCIPDHNPDHDADLAEVREKLARLSKQGGFTGIGAAVIHGEHIDLLFSEPDSPNDLFRTSLQQHMEQELAHLAARGRSHTSVFSLDTPHQGHTRLAVIYNADATQNGTAYLAAQHSSIIERQLADQLLRLIAAGMGMLVLAVPLIILFSRAQRSMAAHLAEKNEDLQNDVSRQKSRQEELQEAISDLERFTSVSTGRESRIIELKSEVNRLLREMGRKKRYTIDKID